MLALSEAIMQQLLQVSKVAVKQPFCLAYSRPLCSCVHDSCSRLDLRKPLSELRSKRQDAKAPPQQSGPCLGFKCPSGLAATVLLPTDLWTCFSRFCRERDLWQVLLICGCCPPPFNPPTLFYNDSAESSAWQPFNLITNSSS